MLHTTTARRGMVTAPHHLATQAGLRVLQDDGNAVEAMIATAATIAVVYPHMNGLGGDNFWLIHEPGKRVRGIDACGAAAAKADIDFYAGQGHTKLIPSRGPLAALTVAGAVSGWYAAHRISAEWGGKLSLERLLEDATYYAEHGHSVTPSQAVNTAAKMGEMGGSPGFSDLYLQSGGAPSVGDVFKLTALAQTLRRLARDGLDGFYRGELARAIAADLAKVGSPLAAGDLERHHALNLDPLSVKVGDHTVFNMPPPTQGLASQIILAVYQRLGVAEAEGFDFVHGLVESTKQAFRVRDKYVTDPAYMTVNPNSFLENAALDKMAAGVNRARAAPWPDASGDSDTVWFGCIDGEGRAVSLIQSLYWEFGSGVVLPETGITWQNRGTSFQLNDAAVNALKPGRRPFHTIQPAMAQLADGRTMVYGTMGGEGQPQTQAMVFSRHVLHEMDLQQSVTAPRWLLGRTWGAEKTNLRIENRFDPVVLDALKAAGHDVEIVGPFEEFMGHAGAIVRHSSGLLEGAGDPRSDGGVAGF
ncbi:MAG: gamma-glutamyltransferase family protein [Rhodospirillaceae bacterium]